MPPQVIKVYTENNDYQYIETLRRNRTRRFQAREFFVEGVRAISQALLNQWELTALVYSREKRLSDWAAGVIAQSNAKRHYELPYALLQKLSQKDETSELLALAAMPANTLTRIPEHDPLLVVVLDRPSSPGNLGAIIRSCDALGVNGVVITGHAADLYDPETIRATAGSFFSLPVVTLASPSELTPWLAELKARYPGMQIVGTSAKSTRPIQEHNLTLPSVILIGNETHGLSAAYKEQCDAMVTIPMVGSASSMNVACATSVILYECTRQRTRPA